MKITLIAATLFSLAALPAFAGEGNGDPFPLRTPGVTTSTQLQTADVGSAQYPDVAGRPGSMFTELASNMMADVGNEVPVQTANSLPSGFERQMLAYARPSPAVPVSTASSMTASAGAYGPRS